MPQRIIRVPRPTISYQPVQADESDADLPLPPTPIFPCLQPSRQVREDRAHRQHHRGLVTNRRTPPEATGRSS